jgi:hypothetical protein
MGTSNINESHLSPLALTRVRARGAHRITVNATGFNLLATASLNGVVESHHEYPIRREDGNQQREQDATGRQRRPSGAAQDAMIVLEVLIRTQTADTQGSGDGALTRRENGTDNEYLHTLEHGLGEQRREAYNEARQFERQCRH